MLGGLPSCTKSKLVILELLLKSGIMESASGCKYLVTKVTVVLTFVFKDTIFEKSQNFQSSSSAYQKVSANLLSSHSVDLFER